MEWQQILSFYQVAKLGSFTRAAEAAFRTQSALSQQIKALEEELGCQLLERIGKRKLRLTAAGEKFLRFAQGILEDYGRLQEELSAAKGLHQGPLRLAAPFTTLYHLFRESLQAYMEQFPQVQLSILDRSQSQVIDLVKAGDLDFGLALESLIPKNLAIRRWKKVETFLMVPPGHPLTAAKKVTIQEIARYPLILPPKGYKSAGRATLEGFLNKQGIDYHVVMESSNVELSSLYVELGLGVSFATVAADLLPLSGRKLAFIPLGRYFKPDYLAVVMRRDKVLAPYKEAFLGILFEKQNQGRGAARPVGNVNETP
ncbi:MAG: LysR family transcriptional regulator [Deltaproteobacteria bacterium]|nr:LysR family transcriptional regulator [Deltaproteobacteria bacterium]